MGRPYVLKTKTFCIGDIAADSDAIKTPLWKLDHAIKISAVRLGADTACNAADTNYNTFALTDGTDDIATLANGPATGGQDFVAGSMHEMTLVTAQAERASGDQLKFEVTKTGNGLALSGAVLQIEYYDYCA